MDFLSNVGKSVSAPIHEENKLADEMERKGRKIIRLNRGDPAIYFPTPKYIIKAYNKALMENKTHYADPIGIRELREEVAKRQKRLYGTNVDEDSVVITQGVSEAILFLNAATMEKGATAIIPKPYYPSYISYMDMFEGKPTFFNYNEGSGWSLDMDSLAKAFAISKPKYIAIANPSNPTGSIIPKKALREIADMANENDTMLVVDEIYDEIVFNGARFTSMSQLARGIPHVIFNGVSKVFDATGLRIGYAIFPEEDKKSMDLKTAFENMADVRLSANVPSQYAMVEALRNRAEHEKSIKAMVSEIEKRVNFSTDMINQFEYMEMERPSGAYYLFPRLNMEKLKFKNDGEFTRKLLEEEGIQIVKGSGFGAEDHIRIVSLADTKTLETAINAMYKFCAKHER